MSDAPAPHDRRRLEELFDRALDLPAAEHAAFLDAACDGDDALRAELARLLAGHAGPDLLDRVAIVLPSRSGTRIGPYELRERIGEGGMGDVYAAVQHGAVSRRVAVKLIRSGMDSAHVLARFDAERQALARMKHPNIAQVYDGGAADDGRPFFAMELVEGLPITAHCDRGRLSTRARIEIFLGVCDGVQHAHQKGIIHRDLKPSNLLVATVDGRAVPKIIDFGVARAMTGGVAECTLFTMVGQIVGTLDYMSPEQADPGSADVDTRSDVYSLGVVLYELLSGLLPFEQASAVPVPLAEVQRAIREVQPPTPSTRLRRRTGTAAAVAPLRGTDARALIRQLAGDLDWICLKALEKDPERRYASASEMAEDLRRHLAYEPVLAGRPGALYRAHRFVRRNRVSVTAAALVAGVALAGVWGVARARIQTEARAHEVLRLSALQTLDDLVAEADTLWPAHPQHLERYDVWLGRAAQLAAELPDHEATLRELRTRALDGTGPPWAFQDSGDRWWHDQLEKLVERLRAFSDPESGLDSEGVSAEHGWGVRRRYDWARRVVEETVRGQAAAAWESAAARVATSPRYDGLVLAPQLGLLPLGPDPETRLEEFAHPQTGSLPARDASGELVLTEEVGLVFVLLPGGTFRMGAQSTDPDGPNYDEYVWGNLTGPVHDVTVSPFFLSKYEMTQGQWERFAGSNPSRHRPETSSRVDRLHPVEMVDWFAADEQCKRLGLSLPSEAQWEYGARSGTSTVWWTGDVLPPGAANVTGWPAEAEVRSHSPVASYPGNAFGLFEVIGNVWEWTLDGFDEGFYARSAGPDPVCVMPLSANRVLRGGGFGGADTWARCAARRQVAPTFAGGAMGLRAARSVTR